ncbi:hypothetical protein GCM10011611_67360 [Aliidongia dinghuensis]|uniref:General secretion pathway protein M n=1 Tax=Aliidongia dinghuensis TaxID=1867774 RepID=A0A8J3E7W9_9PROT|nr:type II secretion system protein GspM [Aliidongia dinghuensis]GGF51425.1 hypothetical protein GCM10011611_67360 [Aliidongia dinghuensis]
MTERQTRLLRRLAALAIGGALLLAFVAGGVAPLVEAWADTRAGIERSSQLLAGYQRVVDQRTTDEQRLARLQQQDAGLTDLIGGATAALAMASLQADVKQIIEAHGGKIQSLQPGAVTPTHGFDRLEVKVDFSIAGDTFPDLVAGLDGHRPFLTADPLELHATDGAQPSDKLIIRMTVSAYRRAAAS